MNFIQNFRLPIRKSVFWPPILILVLTLFASILYSGIFEEKMKGIQAWLLQHFSLGYSWLSFFMLILVLWVIISPLGNYKIGGKNTQPRLSFLSWFAIVLCTTIAVGILFWGSAEPLSHFLFPPSFKNIESASSESQAFALGALFFHWGFTPYAIYTIPALAFGLLYYNGKNSFELGLMLRPLFGQKLPRELNNGLDMFSLFAMVSGMAGALGAGILSLSGGILHLIPNLSQVLVQVFVTFGIVSTFILSASTGIEKGIKRLSLFNLFFFLVFVLIFLILSKGGNFIQSIFLGIENYGKEFLDLSLQLSGKGNQWTYDWSVFNFAMWMAWAPMAALFLGKIAKGRTVREFILVNCFLPAIFCLIWMAVFGGSTLEFASLNPSAYEKSFTENGPESIIYLLFQDIGFENLLTFLFLVGMFISYVTAADSSTEAMASLSMKGRTKDVFKVPSGIKIIWGLLVGAIAFVMIFYSGIDGVRILSAIGGFPAFLFLILITLSLILLSINPSKYLD